MGCSSSKTDSKDDSNNKDNNLKKAVKETSKSSEKSGNILKVVEKYNQDPLAKHYKIIEKLGSGTFGRVYKAMHIDTNQFRAIKVVKKEMLKYQDDEKTFLKEIELLAKLSHPNIIKVFEYFTDESNYYVIQELALGGELYEQIYKIQSFSEKNSAILMSQLLSAVYYLHSNDIVHRDIKPENIMLESKKQGDYNIKLIDFGTANYCKQKQETLTLKVGTPYYIAPEVIKKKYDNKCDVWSCGIILYILLCGYPPFDGDDDSEIMENIQNNTYSYDSSEWDEISQKAKKLIDKMLVKDPKKRISAEEALNDEWIFSHKELNDEISAANVKNQLNNLKKFSSKQKLQKASISYIVNQMASTEMTKELRKIFKQIDSSGDGRLTYDELKQGFMTYYKGSSLSQSEFSELIKNVDTDNNGFIEYEEFLSATMNIDQLLTEKNLEVAFNYFDKDGSGKLDANEIKQALGMISKGDEQSGDERAKEEFYIKTLIAEIDTNKDGEVSFDEFKALMKKVLEVD